MALLIPLFYIATSVLFSVIFASGSCGNINLSIVGGHNVSIEDVPYIVSIFSECDPVCSGSIIDPWFILTSAHCIVSCSDAELKVMYGSADLSQGGSFVTVTDKLCHDDFDMIDDYSINDICVLKLQEPIPFERYGIAKVKLPDSLYELEVGIGTLANVTGWGLDEDNNVLTNDLRQTAVPIVAQQCCSRVYPEITPFLDTYLCAGSQGHDACEGDSGGPLVVDNIQIGIVTAGKGCGIYPGLYTNVSSYLDWIYERITIV